MIDTHAHINTVEFDDKINLIIDNAKKANLKNIFAVGMDYETSLKAINLSKQFEMVYATVGIHPSYVNDSDHNKLNDLYNNEKVVAVGEIGLDYYWTSDNKELQEKVFEEQIQKAIKLNLPIIIHTRNSFIESYKIVKKYQGQVTGVFHCFTGTVEEAKMILDLGFYLGVDGPVTFKNAANIKDIVKFTPLSKLLIETDSPYLAPTPYRGKKNEPSYLPFIAKEIALIKNVSFEEVVEQTTNNAIKLFKLGE